MLRLAIPNKGRIAAPVADLIEKGGLHLREGGERRLIAKTCDPHVEVLFARPVDIPEFVATGAADLGITGHDMVLERAANVEELLDLGIGSARLVLAVPEEAPIQDLADLEGARIATEFPGLTTRYFSEHGIAITIIPVSGACEAAPHLGIADAVVDLTSSGTTLKTNHLKIITDVLQTTTVLIANRQSLARMSEKVEEIRLALESVLRAQGQCYLMMNVQRSCLQTVKEVLPGLSGPTVMDVASDENLLAVHAVVEEERIYQLIRRLKEAGARDILVTPIIRMIR